MFLFLLSSSLCFLGVTKVDKPAGRPAVICNLIPGFEHALTTGPIRGPFLPAQRVQPAFGFRFFFVVGKRVSPVSDFFLGLGNEKHVPEQRSSSWQNNSRSASASNEVLYKFSGCAASC